MNLSLGSVCCLALLVCGAELCASAQTAEPWPLWQSAGPGFHKGDPGAISSPPDAMRVTPQGEHVITHVAAPSITPFLPSANISTGVAVVIAPGGGHSEIWIDHEGYNVARWLQEHGVAAFVLKYRLAREQGSTYTVEGTELADMQRAIRLVRSRAAQDGLDPARIGVMGFSAGGELAALASTHADDNAPAKPDSVDQLSARPAFEALLYPAIPRDMPITSQTPPAFLACGELDRPDIARGLPTLYLKLRDAGVSTELHIFAHTGHGFGLRSTNPPDVAEWPSLFLGWLGAEGFLAKTNHAVTGTQH